MGFEDETWRSRFERPNLHASFSEAGRPRRLIEQPKVKDDPDPKALAAYGMLVRSKEADGQLQERVVVAFRGWPSHKRHNHYVSSVELPEARGDGQEGAVLDLGQRQLAHQP